jgi:DHA2 family multidrug resistance protein-like MFS transporter
MAIAVWISSFSAGSAIGPFLGGLLLEFFWWGSVFLLAVPVMILLLILGPRVLPEYKDPKEGMIDFLSVFLSFATILPIIFGLKQIAQDGVSSLSLVALFIGIGSGVVFVRRQLLLKDPMIDLKLFKNRAFSASLVVNFLAIFVAIGYFLFVAQYLQLVLNLSPLNAGLLSIPSAVGFIIGSNLVPRIAHKIHPANVIGICLGVAALGLAVLTQVGTENGLVPLVAASVIISLGLAPVFGLTTELIVGSAPPERAGAASGIAETAGELGGALGISILGSIGIAMYRSSLSSARLENVPSSALEVAKDTLGAAVGVAHTLPKEAGDALLSVAKSAFVQGMQVAALISVVVAIGIAILSFALLRKIKPASHN